MSDKGYKRQNGRLHVKVWMCDNNTLDGPNRVTYNPHNLDYDVIMMAMRSFVNNKSVMDVSTEATTVIHGLHNLAKHGHEVRIAATREQWRSIERYLDRGFNDALYKV